MPAVLMTLLLLGGDLQPSAADGLRAGRSRPV